MTTATKTDRELLDGALRHAVKDFVNTECCSSCSTALVPNDTESFAYYHAQDAERAFNEKGHGDTLVGSMYVGFGPEVSVGVEIVNALEAAGFVTEWDKTLDTRIRVVGKTVYLR